MSIHVNDTIKLDKIVYRLSAHRPNQVGEVHAFVAVYLL
jgi:hypothetical protein